MRREMQSGVCACVAGTAGRRCVVYVQAGAAAAVQAAVVMEEVAGSSIV